MVTTVQQAALLLQQVAQIASEEVSQDSGQRTPTLLEVGVYHQEPSESSAFVKSCAVPYEHHQDSHKPGERRIRAVSVSTPPLSSVSSSTIIPHLATLGASPLPPPPRMVLSRARFETHTLLPIVHPISPPHKALPCPPSLPVLRQLDSVIRHVKYPTPSSEGSPEVSSEGGESKPTIYVGKFVGTSTPHKVKGTLRHKFSWKYYPEVRRISWTISVSFSNLPISHKTPFCPLLARRIFDRQPRRVSQKLIHEQLHVETEKVQQHADQSVVGACVVLRIRIRSIHVRSSS